MKSWRLPSAKRITLKTLVAAALLAAAPLGAAASAPLTRVETRVELAGAAAIAAHLKRALPRYVAAELAATPIDAPPGTRLVLRITDIFLSNDLGGEPDGGIMMDALDGEALLIDAKGAVLARKPIASRAMPSIGPLGALREPQRVEALAESLAYWVVRAFR